MRQYHVQLEPGDIGEYVLMPGDPGRVPLIAERLDGAKLVMNNREFTTWTGQLDGVAVSVTSTGIGGPSTAICAEELCAAGASTFIRVGSCGALDPSLRFGSVVVALGATRDDGTSAAYAPASFPAVAHIDVVNALREGGRDSGHQVAVGTVTCADGFYPELDPDRMPRAAELRAHNAALRRCGALAAEMESSTLFVVAAVLRKRAGAVLGVVNEVESGGDAMPEAKDLPLQATIDTAIAGVRRLIAEDTVTRS